MLCPLALGCEVAAEAVRLQLRTQPLAERQLPGQRKLQGQLGGEATAEGSAQVHRPAQLSEL